VRLVGDVLGMRVVRNRSDYTERHAREDEEMSKNTYPLKLPTSVRKAAAELAANDGVSLNLLNCFMSTRGAY
jgi:hypothetical protein